MPWAAQTSCVIWKSSRPSSGSGVFSLPARLQRLIGRAGLNGELIERRCSAAWPIAAFSSASQAAAALWPGRA